MDMMTLFFIAMTAIGLTEWAKVPFPAAPKLAWWILMPALCFALAAVHQYLPPWVMLGAGGVSISALAYDNIVQLAKALIEKLKTGSK